MSIDPKDFEVVVHSLEKVIRAAERAEALGTVGTMLSSRILPALIRKGVLTIEEVRAMADDALLSLETRQNLPNMEQPPVELARELLEVFLKGLASKDSSPQS